MLNLYFVLKILMKKGFDNNTNHCQTTDVNEVRIENAIKQFDEVVFIYCPFILCI